MQVLQALLPVIPVNLRLGGESKTRPLVEVCQLTLGLAACQLLNFALLGPACILAGLQGLLRLALLARCPSCFLPFVLAQSLGISHE